MKEILDHSVLKTTHWACETTLVQKGTIHSEGGGEGQLYWQGAKVY